MSKILEYIEQNNESGFHCYSTKKVSLDDNTHETVTSENSDTDTTQLIHRARLPRVMQDGLIPFKSTSLITNTPPYFKYFLDGSRHTYKVDDIAIGNKIFPIVAGQIVVGCCHRTNRDTFKKVELCTKIVISLPKSFHTKGKPEDFSRFYCQKYSIINNFLYLINV